MSNITHAEKILLKSIESIDRSITDSITAIKTYSENNNTIQNKSLQQVYDSLQASLQCIRKVKQDVERNIKDSCRSLSFAEMYECALHGDPEYQYELGAYYSTEEENDDLAFEWYEKSANNDNVYGMYKLGLCYEKGLGVDTDTKKAFYWYKRAADQGNADAQYKLALAYMKGDYLGQNINLALNYCRTAAANNNIDAKLLYGLFFNGGTGLSNNCEIKCEWFKNEIDPGNSDAKYEIDQSDPEYKEFIRSIHLPKLSDKENARAQFILASYYQSLRKFYDLASKLSDLASSAHTPAN